MSEVYNRYVDTAGNYHYTDVETGHHVIPNTAVGNFPPPQTIQTNADRIRSMTDEELAGLWWEHGDCGECPVKRNCSALRKDCIRLILDWLKKEVET